MITVILNIWGTLHFTIDIKTFFGLTRKSMDLIFIKTNGQGYESAVDHLANNIGSNFRWVDGIIHNVLPSYRLTVDALLTVPKCNHVVPNLRVYMYYYSIFALTTNPDNIKSSMYYNSSTICDNVIL